MTIGVSDYAGYGEAYTASGCYVTRHENGDRIVEAWGPYKTERQCENARRRIRRGDLNATDRKLHHPDGLPHDCEACLIRNF